MLLTGFNLSGETGGEVGGQCLESVEDGDYSVLLGEGWEGDEDAPTVIHMGENPTKHLALAAGLRHVGSSTIIQVDIRSSKPV